jgi:benzoyl-CoA reductase/2-hydroxyglutaryl-CoA dehydratase subunit BcrC/BadD/HgdB
MNAPNMQHMRNKVEYLGAVNCERNYLTAGGVGQLRTRVQAFLERLA